MAVLSLSDRSLRSTSLARNAHLTLRQQTYWKWVVTAILAVIVVFQLINLPGAILMHSAVAVWTVVLGLVLCGLAMFFNYLGRVTIVSILLIMVVDLGCGLMLLTTPMGLDVGDLPVFDVLIVSELIAVSLLPAISVFPVALSNIVFIIVDLLFQPRTPELKMMLMSSMAYNAIAQPISLQIVVAFISYIWVRNTLIALGRADRAEEIAELRQRELEMKQQEAERQRLLDDGIQHLSHVLVQAANGNRAVRAHLGQDNVLWRVGNSFNLLLNRMNRVEQIEQENRRLRVEVARLQESLHIMKTISRTRGEG